MLGRRLQVLLDDERYRRLADRARQTNRSVGALIRDAIDVAYPPASSRRAKALRRILDAERIDVPPPEELRRELEELRGRRG